MGPTRLACFGMLTWLLDAVGSGRFGFMDRLVGLVVHTSFRVWADASFGHAFECFSDFSMLQGLAGCGVLGRQPGTWNMSTYGKPLGVVWTKDYTGVTVSAEGTPFPHGG